MSNYLYVLENDKFFTSCNSLEDNNVSDYKSVRSSEYIRSCIISNVPLENKLHIVTCISNCCGFNRRYELALEFIKRMDTYNNVELYVVELAYNDQEFKVTDPLNKNHLQLRTNESPLWAKENLMNIGVKKLLPLDWKAVAFCDADIEFDSTTFALDTLKVLNGSLDIVHMHSHCLDLNLTLDPMSIFSSFGFQYTNKRNYSRSDSINFWHPGFNIAMTRRTYEQMGGIYQESILGSGDHNLYLCLIGRGIQSVHQQTTKEYKQSILEFEKRCIGLRLGYIPGIIKHYFHGSKKNRKYTERWQILIEHQYNPYTYITTDSNGVLIPTKDCPPGLLIDIKKYFHERNEDELIDR